MSGRWPPTPGSSRSRPKDKRLAPRWVPGVTRAFEKLCKARRTNQGDTNQGAATPGKNGQPQNLKKNTLETSQIPQQISRSLSKPTDFKGKVQKRSKSTDKVCKKCEQTAICQNIIAESWGGDPPRCNILTYRSLFSLFVYF